MYERMDGWVLYLSVCLSWAFEAVFSGLVWNFLALGHAGWLAGWVVLFMLTYCCVVHYFYVRGVALRRAFVY